MNFFKKLFRKNDQPIQSYQDFWAWFRDNAQTFHHVIQENDNIVEDFFDQLSPKLDELREGFYFLTGMRDENTAELILTADGNLKNIVFVEELVAAAPVIDGWLFTALKSSSNIENTSIEMYGYSFDADNLFFYANEHKDYPDEIDLTIVYNAYQEEDKKDITNGIFIFLDNYLGELDFTTKIDYVNVISPVDATEALVPIEKLKQFINWREKEFIEKNEGIRMDTDNDNYSILEAQMPNGNALIMVVNTDLLEWDKKASHPWILEIKIPYDGTQRNGMPDEPTMDFLNMIEEKLLKHLVDSNGYLNIGRQTGNGVREIYFACKGFRLPSKIADQIQREFKDRIGIEFEIYKDKYWQSFNRFVPKE